MIYSAFTSGGRLYARDFDVQFSYPVESSVEDNTKYNRRTVGDYKLTN